MGAQNEIKRSNALRKLTGWKSISRHLGRSERAVQLWEVERKLPIHRIPGGRGQTVYAFVEELDAWMAHGASDNAARLTAATAIDTSEVHLHPAAPSPQARPPGILVLPLENHDLTKASSFGDALCQQLIARLAAVQRSIRVLSWQTSKNSRHWVEPLATMASLLNVRYLVEGAINFSDGQKHVDIRVIDAELDQVVLADRFVSSRATAEHFQDEVAEAVAAHFALIHEGALVEPMCLTETAPATLLDYLRGVQQFFEGRASTIDDVLESMERALARDPGFTPARAMKGLALLQSSSAGHQREACTDRVRTIATICTASTSARVTSAFLNAAIAIACDDDWGRAEAHLAKAMRWLPPSIPSRGRLYERRSALRPRPDEPPPASFATGTAQGPLADIFENLLALLAMINHRDAARTFHATPHKSSGSAGAQWAINGSVGKALQAM